MRTKRRGFTLIELVVVMAIVLSLVLISTISVSSMLKSARLNRATSLLISSADEARTAAVTYRRSTSVDITRLDEEGELNRLTVAAPFENENFESYSVGNPAPNGNGPKAGDWVSSSNTEIFCENDGSRVLRCLDGKKYWKAKTRKPTGVEEDYEVKIQARVKYIPPVTAAPGQASGKERVIRIFASGKGSTDISDAYVVSLVIKPTAGTTAPGRNVESKITLGRMSGALRPIGDAKAEMQIDKAGSPSKTTSMVQGVWYRVSLSIKQLTDQSTKKTRSIVAAKVWVDGALEPWNFTCGPLEDTDPLPNGASGIWSEGTDAYLDDLFIDARPTRPLPMGLRIDPLDPYSADRKIVQEDSRYYFPILFRPDGTTSERYVIQITDLTTGDRRYVTIDQNTGRSRISKRVEDALAR